MATSVVGRQVSSLGEHRPRAMRRTFQDLMLAGGVDGVVAMPVSGHRTELMRAKY